MIVKSDNPGEAPRMEGPRVRAEDAGTQGGAFPGDPFATLL